MGERPFVGAAGSWGFKGELSGLFKARKIYKDTYADLSMMSLSITSTPAKRRTPRLWPIAR
jgi:hypothetical protein